MCPSPVRTKKIRVVVVVVFLFFLTPNVGTFASGKTQLSKDFNEGTLV